MDMAGTDEKARELVSTRQAQRRLFGRSKGASYLPRRVEAYTEIYVL